MLVFKQDMANVLIDKLAYIFIKDKKVLVTLSRGKTTWYIPGGKRELGETDTEALIREVKEELTVDIRLNTIRKYGIFKALADGKPEGILVQMTCYTAYYDGNIRPSSEIEKVEYFSYSEKYLCSAVDNLIFDDLYKNGLID